MCFVQTRHLYVARSLPLFLKYNVKSASILVPAIEQAWYCKTTFYAVPLKRLIVLYISVWKLKQNCFVESSDQIQNSQRSTSNGYCGIF